MKKAASTIFAALVAFMLGAAPLALHAHGEEHANEVQYDPVENEFGSYAAGFED